MFSNARYQFLTLILVSILTSCGSGGGSGGGKKDCATVTIEGFAFCADDKSLFIPSVPKDATELAGEYGSDLKLSIKNSPYKIEMSSDVVIKKGAILTIDPGVEIYSYGGEIIVHGHLIANGTKSKPINFYNIDILPDSSPSKSSPRITISYAKFHGGSPFTYDSYQSERSASFSVKNSIIVRGNPHMLDKPRAGTIVSENIFIGNNSIAVDDDSSIGNSTISHNTFFTYESPDYNHQFFGIEISTHIFSVFKGSIHSNSFIDGSPKKNAKAIDYYTESFTLDISNNYWGTTDAEKIEKMFEADINYIEYEPFLLQPSDLAPDISAFTEFLLSD